MPVLYADLATILEQLTEAATDSRGKGDSLSAHPTTTAKGAFVVGVGGLAIGKLISMHYDRQHHGN